MFNLKPDTREKLKKVATPTLMTALYKRGLRSNGYRTFTVSTPLLSQWSERRSRFDICQLEKT
jgi:hypothetical protein